MPDISIWINVIFAIVTGEMVMSEGNKFCLSNATVTWKVATDSSELLSLSYIRVYGWDNMTSLLPKDGDPVWLAARAKHTPYFAFEGYYSDKDGLADCPKHVWNGTSIADCQRKCEYSGYFALKGNDCVCMENKTCLEPWRGSCDEMARCLYNPMDKCGDCSPTKNVYAVYEATFGEEVEVDSDSKKFCVYVIQGAANQHMYNPVDCDAKFIRRYICINSDNTAILKDAENATNWNGARNKCLEERMSLHSSPGTSSTGHRPYWTSVRRSIDIDWLDEPHHQNKSDGHPLCVSARLSSSRVLELQEENCQQQYRFLYNCGKKEEETNKQKEKENSWFVLPFDYKWLFLALILGIPVTVWFYKRKRTTETKGPCSTSSIMQPLSEYITPYQSHVYNQTNDPGEPPRLENFYDELPDPDVTYNGYNVISETGTQCASTHIGDNSYSFLSI